jgi:hypothetical protein
MLEIGEVEIREIRIAKALIIITLRKIKVTASKKVKSNLQPLMNKRNRSPEDINRILNKEIERMPE